jgi:hypothetical protein
LDEMIELEQAEKAADAARAGLELAQADSSGRDQNLNKERERLAAMLGQRSEEREAAADGVSQEDMLLYQIAGTAGPGGRRNAGRDVRGLRLTARRLCSPEVRSGLGLIRCQQCGRILAGKRCCRTSSVSSSTCEFLVGLAAGFLVLLAFNGLPLRVVHWGRQVGSPRSPCRRGRRYRRRSRPRRVAPGPRAVRPRRCPRRAALAGAAFPGRSDPHRTSRRRHAGGDP